MNDRNPAVSAVIPTRNRPQLVCRAVRSVFSQTMQDLECIVVIDGPDAPTVQALSEIQDPRLRIIALQKNVGGCEARNLGAQAARGEWVALLDDDDEWLPGRLEQQLAAAAGVAGSVTMVVSRYLDRGTGNDDLLRPQTFPREGQPISEFLWCEVSCLGGIVGFPQTSTWLLRRDFLLELPFTRGLKALQDLDWLLRAYSHPHMRVVFLEQPLTIFYNEHAGERVSKAVDWPYRRKWALANRHLFTAKALGFFLVIFCVNPAAQQAAPWPQMKRLLQDVRRYGKVTPKLAGLCFLYTCIYPSVSKVLAPRQRSNALYRVRSLAKLRG